MRRANSSSVPTWAETALHRYLDWSTFSMFCPLMRIGRVRWPIRLKTLLLLVFVFSPAIFTSLYKSRATWPRSAVEVLEKNVISHWTTPCSLDKEEWIMLPIIRKKNYGHRMHWRTHFGLQNCPRFHLDAHPLYFTLIEWNGWKK